MIGKKRSISIILLIAIISCIWVYYYLLGSPSFIEDNAVSIYGIVIQGMSALLSVAIAVIIFRIQSLENRNQLLEESTLNFIFQITQSTYPQWVPSVEEDIRSKGLTERYYRNRIDVLNQTIGFSGEGREKMVEEYAKDRDIQQKRLEESLNRHTRIKQTIERTRKNVFSSAVFLIFPILFSFFLLMVSDALKPSINFYAVSLVVLMSAFGILSLLITVLESTVQNDNSRFVGKTLVETRH